jgi:hypothetical protein
MLLRQWPTTGQPRLAPNQTKHEMLREAKLRDWGASYQ